MVGLWALWGSSAFADLIERATSALLPAGHEDIALNLEICDEVRARRVPPQQAMYLLRQRIAHRNPNVQILAVGLTDLCVKNGGDHFLQQVASRDSMDFFAATLRDSVAHEVKAKLRRCLQDWKFFAESRPEELGYIIEVVDRLAKEGVEFPVPDANAVAAAKAFAETLTAPEWTQGPVCTRCRAEFGTFTRRHHCRNCGRIFCYQCSGKAMPLPWYGIGQDVRVCEGCFAKKKPFVKASAKDSPAPPKPKKDLKALRTQEEADVAQAIQLSLRDAPAKDADAVTAVTAGRILEGDDGEEDTHLAAAIAASLRDMGPVQNATGPGSAAERCVAAPGPSAPAQSTEEYGVSDSSAAGCAPAGALHAASRFVRPPWELDFRDVDNVLTFSQTVLEPRAPWKRTLDTHGMPRPVQNMYDKATTSRRTLVRDLDEGQSRLDELVGMHDRLSSAVRLYDRLLDAQIDRAHSARPAAPTNLPSAAGAPAAHGPGPGQRLDYTPSIPPVPHAEELYHAQPSAPQWPSAPTEEPVEERPVRTVPESEALLIDL
ncbi:Vacuolar protein-sorting-associated protein 27 [Malassezia sp. CBS 17886]|nr:Vacuolar protein-sorting-associated protein 27 [Malassezia sp. CBS 17886]